MMAHRRLISSVQQRRWFTATSGERLRIAIVGGGCAALSSALHLAPLVQQGLVESPIDVFHPPASGGREIGVGLWSTGIRPYYSSERNSHQLLWGDLMHYGQWVGAVGYRSPDGAWLARSQLPTTVGDDGDDLPALLFLREVDMMTALRRAVHLEEMQGAVSIKKGDSYRITKIDENSSHLYSAGLVGSHDFVTERQYHLIVAADGMNSILRKTYGGHRQLKRFTGTGALAFEDGGSAQQDSSWETIGQAEANAIEDRNYTVFRGNANLSVEETGMDGVSFQTWGHGNSMRFATVPLSYPSDTNKRTEKQVWFITTSDDSIAAEADATKRRDLLLQAFSDWHVPICQMLEATPPDEILFERAMAHKHCVGPVLNLQGKSKRRAGGPGPALIFLGDASMTVDPILAQGFTIAMEGASLLSQSVQQGCQLGNARDSSLAFDPYQLRHALLQRHEHLRSARLLKLLRATELVQALGQPSSGITGFVSKRLVRPLMRLSPDFVKRPMFNAVLRYSLGLPIRK